MATKTKNYNLIKPDLTDDADIRVINGNMDVLDTQLKTVADSVISGNKNAYTNISVSSDYTWKFTKGSGANVSYDTIKKSTVTDGVKGFSSYKPNADSTKFSQLQYHFGTIPQMGSTTVNLDCGTLKFNHWGASPFNTALSVPNNSGNRPFLSYQNGTAGADYTIYKELAWKSDADAKLDKTGGNVTGNIYTNSSIFKSSKDAVLQLGGSTDGTHGARIDLSGEKQTDAGLVKITADNGTKSNVMQVKPNGSYIFNTVPVTFGESSATDMVHFGSGNKESLAVAFNQNLSSVNIKPVGSAIFYPLLYRNIYEGKWDKTWVYQWNDLLIQGGRAIVGDSMTNITLPRAYISTDSYILYVSDNNNANDDLSDWSPSGRKVSNTTIALQYLNNRYVTWLTIGGWVK